MYYVFFAVIMIAAIASVVLYGYPALITVLLAAVALAFIFILSITIDGMFSKNN